MVTLSRPWGWLTNIIQHTFTLYTSQMHLIAFREDIDTQGYIYVYRIDSKNKTPRITEMIVCEWSILSIRSWFTERRVTIDVWQEVEGVKANKHHEANWKSNKGGRTLNSEMTEARAGRENLLRQTALSAMTLPVLSFTTLCLSVAEKKISYSIIRRRTKTKYNSRQAYSTYNSPLYWIWECVEPGIYVVKRPTWQGSSSLVRCLISEYGEVE